MSGNWQTECPIPDAKGHCSPDGLGTNGVLILGEAMGEAELKDRRPRPEWETVFQLSFAHRLAKYKHAIGAEAIGAAMALGVRYGALRLPVTAHRASQPNSA